MSNIHTSADQLIGKTPLLELVHIEKEEGLEAKVLGKLEYFNPAGSVKDRIAKAMIDDAEQKGLLKPGSVIIEPTSGNTGIGLVSVAAARGYRIIIVTPETMSVERRQLIKSSEISESSVCSITLFTPSFCARSRNNSSMIFISGVNSLGMVERFFRTNVVGQS